MLPPSPAMMPDTVILQFADTATGDAGDLARDFGEGITLAANVSAPETIEATVAEQGRAMLRCRVMCWTDPEGEDPAGATRKLRKGDGVMWQGRHWTACGPMSPESKGVGGTPVNYRFDMERVA